MPALVERPMAPKHERVDPAGVELRAGQAEAKIWRATGHEVAADLADELLRVVAELEEARQALQEARSAMTTLQKVRAVDVAQREVLWRALLAYIRDEIPFEHGAAWAVDALRAAGLQPKEEAWPFAP